MLQIGQKCCAARLTLPPLGASGGLELSRRMLSSLSLSASSSKALAKSHLHPQTCSAHHTANIHLADNPTQVRHLVANSTDASLTAAKQD